MKKKGILFFLLTMMLFLVNVVGVYAQTTPTPTSTPTATLTPTPTSTVAASPTPTSAVTATPTSTTSGELPETANFTPTMIMAIAGGVLLLFGLMSLLLI